MCYVTSELVVQSHEGISMHRLPGAETWTALQSVRAARKHENSVYAARSQIWFWSLLQYYNADSQVFESKATDVTALCHN